MGDFTGFTFGDIHSSELGITRVSGGDRYTDQLHPEIKDRTVEVPGLNGEYYFGSDFGTRTFDLDIAFDSLTEVQLQTLKRMFGTRDIKKLVFDEHPYKYYMAKLESPIELSYVCFDEPIRQKVSFNGVRGTTTVWRPTQNTERIYKGDGKISFICYFPFAKSNFKTLPTSGQTYYEESSDWAISSGILSQSIYNSNHIDTYYNGNIAVYNPGDISTGFRLYLPKGAVNKTTGSTLTYTDNYNNISAVLQLDKITLKEGDVGILIDTNNELIIGVSVAPISGNGFTYTTSGNLYNQYIHAGHFFKIEPMIADHYANIEITNGTSGIRIFYDYLYF